MASRAINSISDTSCPVFLRNSEIFLVISAEISSCLLRQCVNVHVYLLQPFTVSILQQATAND